MKPLLSRIERDAYWQKLGEIFPHVPAELLFEKGNTSGPEMKHGTSILTCLYSLDGEQIFIAGGGRMPGCDTSIRVFENRSGNEVLVCRGHAFGIYQLALDPRTGFLASASEDFSVFLWNLEQQDAIFLVGVGGEPVVKGHVAFAAQKPWLAIGETEAYESLQNSVFVIDLDSGKEVFRHKLPEGKSVSALTISESGATLTVAVADEQYRFGPEGSELSGWELSKGKMLWKNVVKDTIFSELRLLPGAERIAASMMVQELPQGDFSGACLLNARSGRVIAKKLLAGIGTSVAVSPDGQTLAVAYLEGGIDLLQAFDLTPIKPLVKGTGKGYGSGYCSVQFSPAGKTVIAGTAFHVPDVGTRGELKTFTTGVTT